MQAHEHAHPHPHAHWHLQVPRVKLVLREPDAAHRRSDRVELKEMRPQRPRATSRAAQAFLSFCAAQASLWSDIDDFTLELDTPVC